MYPESYVQRFLLEDLDIRGAIVRLGGAWQAMQRGRAYPATLRDVVGQMAAVTVVIAGHLKQPGRVTIQLQGRGPISLMVIDCDETLNIRGYGKGEVPSAAAGVRDLFGDGHLVLTLDVAGLDRPYQSYVPLEGESLAEIFQAYLLQSEQQETGLWLAADQSNAACLLLQKLPDADRKDPDGWSRAHQLASTVKDPELLRLDAHQVLHRLFHEEEVRIYEPRAIRHDWPPDRDKVATVLRSLGREEIDRLVEEHGEIRMHDELSNHEYVFSPAEIEALFDNPPTLQ